MTQESDSKRHALDAYVRITSILEGYMNRFKIVILSLVVALLGTIELIFSSAQSASSLFVSRTTGLAITLLILIALILLAWAAGNTAESTRLLSRLTKSVSFMMVPPRGIDATTRIANQILETSDYYADLVEKKPEVLQTNVRVKGKSGREHDFDIFIHNDPSLWWRLFDLGYAGDDVIVKRIDHKSPVDKDQIIEIKKGMKDSLKSRGIFPVPSSVYVVSTSGFTDDAIKYVTSRRGDITSRHLFVKYDCTIQLVTERDDGWFEVLNF